MRGALVAALATLISSAPATAQDAGVSYNAHGNPDSVFAQIRTHLIQRKYRIDGVDVPNRWLVVRPPGDETKVDIRVEATRDSARVQIAPVNAKDIVSGLQSIVTVTHDAAIGPENENEASAAGSGDLPAGQWRPAMFVSPQGRPWIARSGLFTADSLFGPWRLAFSYDASIGTQMAFVDEDTIVVGLPYPFDGKPRPYLYRSTNAGGTWSPVPANDLTGVNAVESVGGSVWAFATYFQGKDRRTMFVRSSDGGVTWTQALLPAEMSDVTHVYRVTASTAYLATAGFRKGPVFWRTTDGAASWSVVPTPHDQHVNDIPGMGSRIERIATVGEWLVVREYGKVFATHMDSVHWHRLPNSKDIAADRERNQLFALTPTLHATMLDQTLTTVWETREAIPSASDVEGLLAHDGVGYVYMGGASVFEARNGALRVRRPKQ